MSNGLAALDTISQTVVRGVVDQAIKLPCTYPVRNSYDLTDMCWGRGSCPNSKCSNEILRTDGRRVISRNSYRYQLRGSVTWGDVSLTITGLNERDKGLYCCRIEVPGWFNDIKITLDLQVNRGEWNYYPLPIFPIL
uniref:Immunoglobulin V-set domain-containing protein n=1 Tax=Podarcis muralis TaxID=64176 RepID=A0A670IIM6_PODMU